MVSRSIKIGFRTSHRFMKEPVIQLKDVSRYYKLSEDNVVKAVNGVDITVREGEFVTIFGPSGCGKSTIMHLIGLLDRPTKGQVLINGIDASKMKGKELAAMRGENIGFVFQSFFLTPDLTALENVELPMILTDKAEVPRKKRAKELLEAVDLNNRMNHFPNQLSGGQRQRVAIARALANSPKIVLADEPTGNLDRETGKDVVKLFKKLWQEGRTIIIVTHDPDLAKEAPRVIKIIDGKVISDGKFTVKNTSSYIG